MVIVCNRQRIILLLKIVLALRRRPEVVYEEIGPAAAFGSGFFALVSCDHNGVLLGRAVLSAVSCAVVNASSQN